MITSRLSRQAYGLILLLIGTAVLAVAGGIAETLAPLLVVSQAPSGFTLATNITNSTGKIWFSEDNATLVYVVIVGNVSGNIVHYAGYINITGNYTAALNGVENSTGLYAATITVVNGTWSQVSWSSTQSSPFDAKVVGNTVYIAESDHVGNKGFTPVPISQWLYTEVYVQAAPSDGGLNLQLLPPILAAYAGTLVFLRGLTVTLGVRL